MSKVEITVAERLKRLYELQQIDSELSDLETLKGELPMEVSDLEDEIAGLELRQSKVKANVDDLSDEINKYNAGIKDSEALIEKYKTQLDNVKNNREFEALTKEIELQTLEIQLVEKKIKELGITLDAKKEIFDGTNVRVTQRKKELDAKKAELDTIIAKTVKDEERLLKKSDKAAKGVEERFLKAYAKIRDNFPNKLAVVTVTRSSCGGCFNKIPPQTQLEIGLRKKIIVCEYCGRILVDEKILEVGNEPIVA